MAQLAGTWRVVGPAAHWPHGAPTLTFEGDGMVYGSSGVNRIRGTWTYEDDVLRLGPIVSTLVAGPPDAMDAEDALQRLLAGPLRVELTDDGALVLHADDDRSLRLEPTPPGPTTV